MAFGLSLIEARKSAEATVGQAPKRLLALFFISRKKSLASPCACAYNARVTSERLIRNAPVSCDSANFDIALPDLKN
jgi:hypothetical protein